MLDAGYGWKLPGWHGLQVTPSEYVPGPQLLQTCVSFRPAPEQLADM